MSTDHIWRPFRLMRGSERIAGVLLIRSWRSMLPNTTEDCSVACLDVLLPQVMASDIDFPDLPIFWDDRVIWLHFLRVGRHLAMGAGALSSKAECD